MHRFSRRLLLWIQSWRLSLFEKVILVNSFMLIGEALAGLWVTNHHLESHHYLIDTLFIVIATLLTIGINILVLQANFRPLFSLLQTIRRISAGKTQTRAKLPGSSWEIQELAQAFNNMLDRLTEIQREQTTLILEAQEDERRRISMELHDEAGQNLTALLIHAEIIQQSFHILAADTVPEKTRQRFSSELQQLIKLTQMTLENIRVLSQQLRPSVLDDLGLLAAFRWLVEDGGQRLHLAIELEIHNHQSIIEHLPAAYETALFRIAQESLTNTARHAQAHHVVITLGSNEECIYVRVVDDGQGFETNKRRTGSGTLGMRERANSLGGTLTIQSVIGVGTTVQASLPLPNTLPVSKAENIVEEGEYHEHTRAAS